MDQISQFFNFLDGILGSAAYFPIALLGAGVLFSFYLGFPQIRFFKHAWGVLLGKYAKDEDPGDTSHFQALSTALSGTWVPVILAACPLPYSWAGQRLYSGCGLPPLWV